jgi:NAD(P)-dependent dehydrogenase (short-subunit alcohol dehydrogenase family)
MFSLKGKVALVTGGSRGMGRSMARAFAGAGADVIVVSRHLDACKKVALEIEELTGQRALPYACHVGYWDQIERLVDFAYEEFGKVDVLVNNAGMSPLHPEPPDITEDLYDKVFAVNLKGPFRLMALIGARMAAGEGGSIINVSSHSATHPDETAIPYAAAKAGLNTMTVAFAHAFGPKVRVNCIAPGAFLTDISKSWDFEDFENKAKDYALGRGGHPDEIVGSALYLASTAASSFTTGAVLSVDGGNT